MRGLGVEEGKNEDLMKEVLGWILKEKMNLEWILKGKKETFLGEGGIKAQICVCLCMLNKGRY